MEKEADIPDFRLRFPPSGIGGQPHLLPGMEFADEIGTGAEGIVRLDHGFGNHREGHGIKQAVITARGFDGDRTVVLGGNGRNEIFQVAVKTMIGDVFILGFIQDIVGGSHHIPGGQRRAVREENIRAEVEGPELSVGGAFPAFRQAPSRIVVIIDCNQTFIDQVVYGQYIAFHRFERTNQHGFRALHAENHVFRDVGGEHMTTWQDGHQRQHQYQANQPNRTLSDIRHSILSPFSHNLVYRHTGYGPRRWSGRRCRPRCRPASFLTCLPRRCMRW